MAWDGAKFKATVPLTIAEGQNVLCVRLSGQNHMPTLCTFNGVDMDLRLAADDQNTRGIRIYDMMNPPVGTYDLYFEGPERSYRLCANGLSGVHTTNPRRGVADDGGGWNTEADLDIATVPDDLVLDVVHAFTGATADSGQTVQVAGLDDGVSSYGGMSSKLATGALTNMFWTVGDYYKVIGAIAYIPAPPPSDIVVGTTYTDVLELTDWNGTAFEGTRSVTVTEGQNVLCVRLSGAIPAPATVKFNGVSLTQRASQTDGNTRAVHIYDLDDPPVGTYNLVVTHGGGYTWRLCVNGLSNVHATTKRRDADGNTVGNQPTVTVDSVAGDLVLDASQSHETMVAGSYQEPQANSLSDGLGGYAGMSARVATGVETTMFWYCVDSWSSAAAVVYIPAASDPLYASGTLSVRARLT